SPLTLVMHAQHFTFPPTPPSDRYTLSLHDALPISVWVKREGSIPGYPSSPSPSHVPTSHANGATSGEIVGSITKPKDSEPCATRSEEHTSELQSRFDLVCRLLLEKKKNMIDCLRYQ